MKKPTVPYLLILTLAIGVVLTGFGGEPEGVPAKSTVSDASIDTVYFAQTHVLEPHQPYFRLVGEKNTLIKVHVLSKTGANAPPVKAVLRLGEDSKTIELSGPKVLPKRFNKKHGQVVHRFDDCFTATIPGKWIHKGLQVTIQAGDVKKLLRGLDIGPSIRLNMTMFDVHYFAYKDGEYSKNWVKEIAIRRPVTEMRVQRMKGQVFPKLLIPPGGGKPAILCSSRADFKRQTGKRFDGEQAAALKWVRALQAAGGQDRVSLFYVNIANVRAGGFAEPFHGCGTIRSTGILHHELGHRLNVEDLMSTTEPLFPYRGPMYGIKKTTTGGYHVGPTWGYDHRVGVATAHPKTPFFINPVATHANRKNKVGEWKHSPVRGGGGSEHDAPGTLSMYSDWSVRKMQHFMEKRIVKWDAEAKRFRFYHDWWQEYRKFVNNNGVSFPVEHEVKVYSIMASASAVTPDANFIYPLIGPYRSGLIKTFDPEKEEDRKHARRLRDFGRGWDICLRVVQGGVTRTYMMPLAWRPKDDPLNKYLFQTRALNVPVRDGKVTRVELLLTPEADINGLPDNPKVLFARDMAAPTSKIVETVVDFGSPAMKDTKAEPAPAKP